LNFVREGVRKRVSVVALQSGTVGNGDIVFDIHTQRNIHT